MSETRQMLPAEQFVQNFDSVGVKLFTVEVITSGLHAEGAIDVVAEDSSTARVVAISQIDGQPTLEPSRVRLNMSESLTFRNNAGERIKLSL